MIDIFKVEFSKSALKELKKIPKFIAFRLQAWIDGVNNQGLSQIRKISGYHDEPLQGKRQGQRSIRLNVAYRAIYEIKHTTITFIEIVEVTKHAY